MFLFHRWGQATSLRKSYGQVEITPMITSYHYSGVKRPHDFNGLCVCVCKSVWSIKPGGNFSFIHRGNVCRLKLPKPYLIATKFEGIPLHTSSHLFGVTSPVCPFWNFSAMNQGWFQNLPPPPQKKGPAFMVSGTHTIPISLGILMVQIGWGPSKGSVPVLGNSNPDIFFFRPFAYPLPR